MSTAPQLWLGITLKDEMPCVKKKIGKSWLFSGPKCDDQALRVQPDFEGMFDLGDSFFYKSDGIRYQDCKPDFLKTPEQIFLLTVDRYTGIQPINPLRT